MEIWKDIKGYEEYYKVSNLGRVKSLDRSVIKSDGVIQNRKGRIKTLTKNVDGYLTVKLSKDGIDKRIGVHDLVALAFVGDKPSEEYEVNHIDNDRANNVPSNLEWVTHKENIAHMVAQGRHYCQTHDLTGENNPNYGNTTLKERYAKDKDFALQKQSRPRGQNGKARKVSLTNIHNSEVSRFDCIVDLCEYLVENGYEKNITIKSLRNKVAKYAKQGKIYKDNFQIDFIQDNTVPSHSQFEWTGVTTTENIA